MESSLSSLPWVKLKQAGDSLGIFPGLNTEFTQMMTNDFYKTFFFVQLMLTLNLIRSSKTSGQSQYAPVGQAIVDVFDGFLSIHAVASIK